MVYQYNPGCCCEGCDFRDDFEDEQKGYRVTAHDGDPVFEIADGFLTLTGGDGSLSRSVQFPADDIPEMVESGTLGIAVIAKLGEGTTGQVGIYIGGQTSFVADFDGQRYVAYEVDDYGVSTGLEFTPTTAKPKKGDTIEVRVAWSPIRESWRRQWYLNATLQFTSEAVEFTGSRHVLGMVGTDGATWADYVQDCSTTLNSQVFCVTGFAGSCFHVPFVSINPPFTTGDIVWQDFGNAIGFPNSVGARAPFPSFFDVGPPLNFLFDTHYLGATNFGLTVPEDVVLLSVSFRVRYSGLPPLSPGQGTHNWFVSQRLDGAWFAPPDGDPEDLQVFRRVESAGVTVWAERDFGFGTVPSIAEVNSSSYGCGVRGFFNCTIRPFTVLIDSIQAIACYRVDF